MSVAGLLGLPFWLVALIGSAGLVAVLIWLERRQSWKTEIGADYDGLMPQISEPAAADHAPAAGLAEKPFLKAHGAISQASARSTALESCGVPLWEVKTWLAGAAAAIDIGDVEGGTLPEFASREQRADTKFLRWDGTEEGAASGRAILASAHGLEAGPHVVDRVPLQAGADLPTSTEMLLAQRTGLRMNVLEEGNAGG